ncbi:protoporphyrinogen oxidase [Salinisphaera sp. LB1]|uniref:protoporphyrinogen oxidase n=1 Tax=Salinisphaera sp. LB1 TaxID=2183911 RepID=UPI000D707884|nr:protoporphyrinogen oxidase [Salinisphaera sp. LB1]AWN16241.1 Protoporphyrinogen IX oxidase, aerobic, HemY [Salinisphaera sp. LB1]
MPEAFDRDVLVVGGGATGLAAAWSLAKAGRQVALLEASDRVGGALRSERMGEWQIEHGPNTVIMKPPLYALVRELSLLGEAQPANPNSRKRFVALDGQPVALPTRIWNAPGNPLIGWRGWGSLLREPFVGRGPSDDESLATFVTRRLGTQVLERLVDPFVSGVYAGDPQRLSAAAAMPRLVELERAHGSLIRGGLSRLLTSNREPASMPREWRGKLLSFPQGLQRLADRLAEVIATRPNATLACNCRIQRVAREGAYWVAEDDAGRRWRAPELVLAVPAYVAARLLAPLDPALAGPLAAIVYPPVNIVSLGFRRADIAHPLDGFGLLIPHVEQRQTLGVLFPSSLFPNRAPAGHHLLSVFLGGRRSPGITDEDDATHIGQAIADLSDLLGIRGAPVWQRVVRWPQAIPQYEIGHLDRLAAVDAALARHPGLSLAGNWRDGIAVGDCLDNGRRVGERVAARAGPSS